MRSDGLARIGISDFLGAKIIIMIDESKRGLIH